MSMRLLKKSHPRVCGKGGGPFSKNVTPGSHPRVCGDVERCAYRTRTIVSSSPRVRGRGSAGWPVWIGRIGKF